MGRGRAAAGNVQRQARAARVHALHRKRKTKTKRKKRKEEERGEGSGGFFKSAIQNERGQSGWQFGSTGIVARSLPYGAHGQSQQLVCRRPQQTHHSNCRCAKAFSPEGSIYAA
jgi:hypothetical protein